MSFHNQDGNKYKAFLQYVLTKGQKAAVKNGLVPAAPAPEKKEEPPQTILNKETSATPVLKNKAREGLAACKSPAERVSYVMKHAAELAQN